MQTERLFLEQRRGESKVRTISPHRLSQLEVFETRISEGDEVGTNACQVPVLAEVGSPKTLVALYFFQLKDNISMMTDLQGKVVRL